MHTTLSLLGGALAAVALAAGMLSARAAIRVPVRVRADRPRREDRAAR